MRAERGTGTTRIVLLGAGGRLGAAFVRRFSGRAGVELRAVGRGEMNLSNPGLIDSVLGPLEFDWLVNAAANTAVDDAELQSGHAFQVNGHAVGQMARLCASKGARLLHFSTDYVFDGVKDGPYTEEDAPNPVSAYGKSKLMGEEQALAAGGEPLVVRLSWLFGPAKPAFPEWVLGQAASGAVRVVADKWACPTYAPDVAAWLDPVILGAVRACGLLHLCHPPACSWLEWAREVLRLAKSDAEIIPISMADLPGLHARRPRNSAMSVDKYERLSGQKCRPWHGALAEHLRGGN